MTSKKRRKKGRGPDRCGRGQDFWEEYANNTDRSKYRRQQDKNAGDEPGKHFKSYTVP